MEGDRVTIWNDKSGLSGVLDVLLLLNHAVLSLLLWPPYCVCVCPNVSDGVAILSQEQRRVDASFTWQLRGSSDVSESAEALIWTGVNHCFGNPEEIEAAWGEVSQASGRLHGGRPALLQ